MHISKVLLKTFAVGGALSFILLLIGLVLDFRSFDGTQGGYEPPYTDYTGTPVDWSRTDLTESGMVYRGYVVNVLVDCTSGLVSFEVYKQVITWRAFSPRAIAVHQPREACLGRGFSPEF